MAFEGMPRGLKSGLTGARCDREPFGRGAGLDTTATDPGLDLLVGRVIEDAFVHGAPVDDPRESSVEEHVFDGGLAPTAELGRDGGNFGSGRLGGGGLR